MAILPIGFFMPLPLAMMIPFMGIQSAVMMKQAGENWQYGKRLQSAMTNEEFNAQTFASIYQKNVANTKEIIPDMKRAIQDMREFQDFIIVEIIELMRRGLETGLGAIFGLSAEQSNQFFGGTTGPPLLEEPTGGGGGSTTVLLDPTFEQVQNFTVTKINLIIAQQLHLYTSKAQGFIHTVKSQNDAKKPVPEPTIPLHTLDDNAKIFQEAVTVDAWPLIGKLRIKALKKVNGARAVLIITNAWFASAQKGQFEARGDTAKQFFNNLMSEILRLIGLRNKWLAKGQSFTL